MATIQRGQILRDDLALFDGVTRTSSRDDATGGSIEGLNIGESVDILQVFGSGDNRTVSTINDAIGRLGGTNRALQFSTGTWTIDSDITIPETATCLIPAGCIFDVSSGVTLTFSGPLYRQSETWTAGTGTVVANRNVLGYEDRSAAEILAGVTPTFYEYSVGNVKRYGALGDDSTDNASAFQSAIDATGGTNETIYIPGGTYRIGSELTSSSAISVRGDGMLRTAIKKTFDGADLFDINTDNACLFRDFSVTSSVTQTSGAYFRIDGASGSTNNSFTRFENIRLGTFYDGIIFEDAVQFHVDKCYFVETTHTCIHVGTSSPVAADNGDSQVTDCVFATSDDTNTYCIRQFANGGLRITGNKFLDHEFQYSGEFGAGITTSVLVIVGNSFENPGTTNIRIDEISTGSFGNVVIVGNQMTANGSGYGMNIADINNLYIGDNTIIVGSGTTAGIILQSVSEFNIGPNVIDGNGAATGISIDSGCANGDIALQRFSSLSANISNSSSSVAVARRFLAGSATWDIANMAADGDVESTTVTVTGASINDTVEGIQLSSIGANAILFNGHISAADTAYVTATNRTGGAVNPASGTINVVVSQAQ